MIRVLARAFYLAHQVVGDLVRLALVWAYLVGVLPLPGALRPGAEDWMVAFLVGNPEALAIASRWVNLQSWAQAGRRVGVITRARALARYRGADGGR